MTNQKTNQRRDKDFERIVRDRPRGFQPRERNFQNRTQPQQQRNFQPEPQGSFWESWNRAGEVMDSTFLSFPDLQWDSLSDLFGPVQREQNNFRRRK